MRVQRVVDAHGQVSFEVLDDDAQPMSAVSDFMRFLRAREYSPNTLSAYAHDLLHFTRFLTQHDLTFADFSPAWSVRLLEYLRSVPNHRPSRRLTPVPCIPDADASHPQLAPTTINRVFAAVSSFYEYLILSDQFDRENPMIKQADSALARVSERHHPFMGRASRQRPMRRVLRVKTVRRVPRPMSDEQITQLLQSLRCQRDKAMIFLMVQGGLRPGEVLNLRLEDIQYGRRRLTIRHRTDHPAGVRTKSRTERSVDLHEPEALQALSDYVMHERPADTDSPFVFLVGGNGKRRHEPLSYHALVKLFQRQCARLNIRTPWTTPHALRHTHATKMWEGGMRELTLQKRLGHASPESTRLYTRVSDATVVAEYRRALGEEPSI